MKKVMVYWTSRSEEGILAPVVKRLEEDPDIQCIPLRPKHLRGTDPAKLGETYSWAYENIEFYAPDLVIAPFDRPEMLMVAIAAMTQNVPVAQIEAGDIAGRGTGDDKTRYAISMIADLIFCNGKEAHERVCRTIFHNVAFLHKVVWDSGSTAIDDIEPDYSLVPIAGEAVAVKDPSKKTPAWKPFDLVLYNPETATEMDLDNLSSIEVLLDEEKPTIFVGPNGDRGSNEIEFVMKKWCEANEPWTYYDSVPRAQFLGLMQKAKRLIGNSSAFCLEIPLLRDDWEKVVTLVGTRNTPDRFLRDSRPGGSDRIHGEIRCFLGLEEASEG